MDYKQIVILVGASFLAINALLLGVGQLYFLAGAVACIPLVGALFCRLTVGGVTCRREVHDRVFEGGEVAVSLTLENVSWLPRLGVVVEEVLPVWLEAEGPLAFYVPALWRGRPVTFSYTAVAHKRGAHRFTHVRVTVSDPPGLTTRTFELSATGEALVYPAALPVAALPAGGLLTYADEGQERLAAGHGGVFYGVREYAPGDQLRHIHWRATARRGELTVMEFERTQAADLLVALDLAAGSEVGRGRFTTLETAITAAASLLDYTVRARAAALLVCHDAAGLHQVLVRTESEHLQALEVLARAEANGPQPLSQVLAGLEPGTAERWGVVIISSAPDPHLAATLADCARPAACTALLVNPAAYQPAGGGDRGVGELAAELAAGGVMVRLVDRPADLLEPALWEAAR